LTLLFGTKSIAESSTILSLREGTVSSNASDRSSATTALAHRLRQARFYQAGRSRHTRGISGTLQQGWQPSTAEWVLFSVQATARQPAIEPGREAEAII